MSFILDALKKSEGERQRQSGPAMFEVRVAPPRNRMPLWATIVGVLLVLNLAIVAWIVLRRAPQNDAVAATVAAPMAAPVPAPAAADVAPASAPPTPTARATSRPEEIPAEPVAEESLFADEGAPDSESGPVLDEPVAIETPRAPSRVTRGTGLGIPTYGQLVAQPGAGVPELRLDLHVFADRPGDRFVFVNNRRLREGESLPDGTRVESIVPDGVVLAVRNRRFLLQRE